MMESGIFVRDFGTRLEEIDLTNSGSYNELYFFYQPFHMSYFLWTVSPIPIGH